MAENECYCERSPAPAWTALPVSPYSAGAVPIPSSELDNDIRRHMDEPWSEVDEETALEIIRRNRVARSAGKAVTELDPGDLILNGSMVVTSVKFSGWDGVVEITGLVAPSLVAEARDRVEKKGGL